MQQVLDMLVVGGGPGGTAAAFRGRELGLDVFVVDYDDLMRRIRDYSKDKLILPSFGGGDRMAFPAGGDLINALRFAPIDKDELCADWKGLYQRHDVPFQIGLELTALEREGDIWSARLWDHKGQAEKQIQARHVVLSLGRGCPRRFDIPGNCDGISYRLEDPRSYIGEPTCVIGGGTSAAEAVIAISNAKAAAGDRSEVFWSYRGDRLPRVSKALAQVFFEAYAGNGNIRYFPGSEPAAVLTDDTHRDVLAVRTDRRRIAGRPAETVHLEFPKTSVIACIGEDLPTALLADFGILMTTGGPKGKQRLAVTPYLESSQKGIFLVGDLLSPAHFETADPATPGELREVRHRGNIKAALRDGVIVAEAVRQMTDGQPVQVQVTDAEPLAVEAESSAVQEVLRLSRTTDDAGPPAVADTPVESAAPGQGATGPGITGPSAVLIRILPGGIEGEETSLFEDGFLTIGRQACHLNFADDTTLADHHASIIHDGEGFMLRDENSDSGVFLRVPVTEKIALAPGDLLAAGRQFLVLAGGGGRFELVCYSAEGRETGRLPLPERTVILGRQAPDALLDPNDKTLSRRQLAFSREGDVVTVKDLKSVNGSYLRLSTPRRLEHGQQFRVGQQRFLLSLDDQAVNTLDIPRPQLATPAPAAPSPSVAAMVTFQPSGKTCPAVPGQTLCEIAEQNGVTLNAECHSGICGSDPVRVLKGAENLDVPSDQEGDTLSDLCDLEAPGCRLACMARVQGPVTIQIL